jgi:hypothetical protein
MAKINESKLDKIALELFYEKYKDCSEKQQKQVLKKYYHEEEKVGVCQQCGTHCDYDVFNCTGCKAPLDKPLRSEMAADNIIINIKGNYNIVISNAKDSNVNIGHIKNANFE